MKKLLTMAFVAITMMTSCSDDDSSNTNNPNSDGPVPVMIVETSEEGTTTSEFTYNGNKLTRAEYSDGQVSEYFYNNNRLSKIMHYWNGEETASEEEHFFYNNDGTLNHYIEYIFGFDDVWAEKTVFSYDDANTISFTKYTGDGNTQTEVYDEGTYVIQNGNIMSYEGYWSGYELTYDNKNASDKNILGSDILTIAHGIGGVNNILSYVNVKDEAYYTYTYNDDGFPVTETIDYGGEGSATRTYTYSE